MSRLLGSYTDLSVIVLSLTDLGSSVQWPGP